MDLLLFIPDLLFRLSEYEVTSPTEGDYNTVISAFRVGGLFAIFFKVHPELTHVAGDAQVIRAPIDYTFLEDPVAGVPKDHFAMRFTGYLLIREQQVFTIAIDTDGGTVVYLIVT